MAGVVVPGIGQQVALVAGLRWRLFRNSLRTTTQWLDLVAVILTTALGGLFILSAGLGLGVAAHFLIVRGNPELLALPLLGVFLFWQLMPLLLASSTTGFDFTNLLRFPLRFPAFFLLSLAYALFDPAAVGSLVWLVCIATGIALAQPELLGWTLLVLAVFAATNLLLSRAVFSWLERLLARRRSREALVVLFILFLLGFQFLGAVGARWEKGLKPYANTALPVLQLLPPGLAGKALAGATRGRASTIVVSTAFLVAYGAAFGLLLHRRLRAQYLGEDLGETPAPVAPRAASPASFTSSTSLASAYLPGPVAAVFEKEFRYLYRNAMTALNLVLPLILSAILLISPSASRQRPGTFARSPEMAFPAAVAYMFLVVAPLAHNSFSFDGRGIQLLLAAPVRFRDVLLGKNLIFGLILVAETGAVWLMVRLLFRPPGAMTVAATLCGLLFAALVHCIVGNWLSLQFPRRFDFGRFRRRASGVSVLIGLALQIVLLGGVAILYFLLRLGGKLWLLPVVLLFLSGVMLAVYLATLDRFTRLAMENREVLTSQLCR